jgi:hypothetical protein
MATQEEMQNTPDLDQSLADGRPVFDGAGDEPGNGAEPIVTGPTGPDADRGSDDGNETTDEGPEGERASEHAAGDKPPADHRFKTHDDAEKGYRELQGSWTKTQQELKAARERLTALEGSQAALDAEKQRQGRMAEALAVVKQRRKETLEAINALDPEDPDYLEHAAELSAQADMAILTRFQEATAAPARPAAAAPTGETGAEAETAADPAAEKAAIWGQIQEQLPEQGLEKGDPLFAHFAAAAPTTNDKGERLDLQAQVAWAVEQTKAYQTKIAGRQAQQNGERHQHQEIPLGRGGAGGRPGGQQPSRETPQGETHVSLSDAVDQAMEARRL